MDELDAKREEHKGLDEGGADKQLVTAASM